MQELWNQTAHGKRVLGGNTSRNPEFKFQYFSEDPTLARLIAQTTAADLPQHDALRAALAAEAVTDEDRARARDWAAFLDLRYVMVHRDKLRRRPRQRCGRCFRWNGWVRRVPWHCIGWSHLCRGRRCSPSALIRGGWPWPRDGVRRRRVRAPTRMAISRMFTPNVARRACCCH